MTKCYSLNQSPFFKLSNKKKLASILNISIKEMLSAIATPKHYKLWSTKPKYPSNAPELRHKPRKIQQPVGILRIIQDRISDLLNRIETPEYLYSTKKGRSYVDNAISHIGNGRTIRIDIKGFYQNSSDKYVRHFFLDDLQCSPDVAHILTELICWNHCLPTGSPASPIISYFAYRTMFNELNALALSIDTHMSLYIDDNNLSGDHLNGEIIPRAKAIIHKYGLHGHKILIFNKNRTRIVTGVAITPDGQLRIPYRRYRKIRALEREYGNTINPNNRQIYLKALIGQYREGSGIEPKFLAKANNLQQLS